MSRSLIWTASKSAQSLDVELHSDFRCLAWHPEGSLLALVGSDFRVQIWNLEKGQKARWVVTLEGQGRPGICMAFGHGGSLLATTAWDGFLRLWDARTGQELKRLQWGGYETPRFSTDDRILAARIDDGSMRFWKITIGGEYRTLTRDSAHGPCVPQDGAIGLDGRLLAVGLQDGVGLWDLKTSDFFAMLSSGSIASVAFENSAPPTLLTNGPEGFSELAATTRLAPWAESAWDKPKPSLKPAMTSKLPSARITGLSHKHRGLDHLRG